LVFNLFGVQNFIYIHVNELAVLKMRRLLAFTMIVSLLLLSSSVFAQSPSIVTCGNFVIEHGEVCDPPEGINGCSEDEICSEDCLDCKALAEAENCGDGELDDNEECDDGDGTTPGNGNGADGDGCSTSCKTETTVTSARLSFALGHNMMFSKVMDLSHISKDLVFQEETKEIQKALIKSFLDTKCKVLPVLFSLPATVSQYGKLNEINALNNLWLFSTNTPEKRAALERTDQAFASALLLEASAENHVKLKQFLLAAREKCCAYAALVFNLVLILKNDECVPPPPGPGGGSTTTASNCMVIDPDLPGTYVVPTCTDQKSCFNYFKNKEVSDPENYVCGIAREASTGKMLNFCECFHVTRPKVEAPWQPTSVIVRSDFDGKEYACTQKRPDIDCEQAFREYGVLDVPENPCKCVPVAVSREMEEVAQAIGAPSAGSGSAECSADSDCAPGYQCRAGKCVQRHPGAQVGRAIESRGLFSQKDIVMIAPFIVIVLALLAYLLFHRRPEAPQEEAKPEARRAPEPKIKEAVPQEASTEIDSELDELEQSHRRIQKMLESLKGGKV
jgi:hypothetical protein